jgi:tetratricopeptide (TPR) repeat protein
LPWLGRTSLPLLAPRLIGREDQVKAIRDNLQGNVLIFSGTGEEGIGTTAMARSVALLAAGDYPDGCIYVNLRSNGPLGPEPLTPAQVQRHVLCSLTTELDAEGFVDEPLALRRMYQSALSERRVLLLLDDATAPSQLRSLLPEGNSAAIITTQNDMKASFPKLYTAKVEGLQQEEAYRLMTQIAPAASSLAQSSVAPLTARLQGIPLALRTIAPLLGRKPPFLLPKRVLDDLEVAQKRITALRGPGFANRTTLIATEVAYELLDPELKPYFEGLGVFPAPFTAHAAATVWNVSPKRAEEILEQLAVLALLDHPPQSAYYELHHLLQLYAQELLLSQPDRAREQVSRYVEHYMREVIRVSNSGLSAAPGNTSETTALDIYTLWEHLPVAWNRATGCDPSWPKPQMMERWVCDFPLQSKALLMQTLSHEENRAWLTTAFEAAETLQDSRIAALHLQEMGRRSVGSGDNRVALDYFERQEKAAREAKSPLLEAEALTDAGVAHGALGDVKAAETSWQKAFSLFEQQQDPRADRLRVWLKELRGRFNLHA